MYKNYTREGYNYSKKGTNQFSKCNQTASAIVFISYTREGYNYSQKEQISSQNASKELLSSSLTTSGLVGSDIESCVMTGVHQRTLQTSYDFLLVFCSDLGLCGSVVRYLRQRRASKTSVSEWRTSRCGVMSPGRILAAHSPLPRFAAAYLRRTSFSMFCSVLSPTVLDPTVGHTTDVLSLFILVLCHS